MLPAKYLSHNNVAHVARILVNTAEDGVVGMLARFASSDGQHADNWKRLS